MTACSHCKKSFPKMPEGEICGHCKALARALNSDQLMAMIDSHLARQCHKCGDFELATMSEAELDKAAWICKKCQPREQSALSHHGNSHSETSGPTSAANGTGRHMHHSIAALLGANKAKKQDALKNHLPLRPLVKIEVYTLLSMRKSDVKRWNHPIADIPADWDWTMGELFDQTWNKVVYHWRGEGMGVQNFKFELDRRHVTISLQDSNGKPSPLDRTFSKNQDLLSAFFRKYYKLERQYGKPSDTSLGHIWVRFTVKSPILFRSPSPEIDTTSSKRLRPVAPLPLSTFETEQSPWTHSNVLAQSTQSNVTIQRSRVPSSRAIFRSSVDPPTESPLNTASKIPEGFECICFQRVYPRFAANDVVVPVGHKVEEEGYLQIKPFQKGGFKLAFKLMSLDLKTTFVAKRYYSMRSRMPAADETPEITLNEDQQYALNWLEVNKALSLSMSLKEFQTQLNRNPKRNGAGFSLGITESFLMLEVLGDSPGVARSWLVEPDLSDKSFNRAGRYTSSIEYKLFGSHFEPEHVTQQASTPIPLPLAMLEEVHAWLHFFFEVTADKSAFPADIQGFLFKKGRERSPSSCHFQLFDLLVHSFLQTQGPGDRGPPGMQPFIYSHKCNALCKQLGLLPFEKPYELEHSYLHDPWSIPFWRRDEDTAEGWETAVDIQRKNLRGEQKQQRIIDLIPFNPPAPAALELDKLIIPPHFGPK